MARLKAQVKATVRFVDSWASIHFDLLRGIAATLVLLEHWRNLFFVDFPQIFAHRSWFVLLYGVSGSGHQSVVCFFVLSGYFIGGSVSRSIQKDQWHWSDYLLRRLVRLWIVLLPTLLLCLLWDRLGIALGHSPALYAGQVNNHMTGDVRHLLAPGIFLGNLFFVQTLLTPVFGSDGALWSLAYEFWYYLLFPLGFLAIWKTSPAIQRVLCALVFVAAAWFVRRDILEYLPMWLLGVLLFYLPAPRFSSTAGNAIRIACTVAYCVFFFGLGRVHSIPAVWNDYILGAATLAYLWILLSHREAHPENSHYVLASREAARFSFTLYAVHTPLLVLLVSLLLGDSRWYPTPLHLLVGVLLFVAVIGFSWALAAVTEFRTDAVRIRIEHIFGMRSAAPALSSNPLAATPQPIAGTDS